MSGELQTVKMFQRLLAGVMTLTMLAACGGSTPPILVTGPTAASVAVQPGDLPADMKKCDLSGDMDSYLNKAKAKDPKSADATAKEWEAAKKHGATAAYAAFYTDSAEHCTTVAASSSSVAAATYKLVANFVVQFKDEASASKGYTSESIFGFSTSSLKSGGAPVVEGTKTGLTPNSIVLNLTVSNQSFFIAVWQNKVFMVILAMLNIEQATCKKAALAENSRIK
jgi:hypothetical protein